MRFTLCVNSVRLCSDLHHILDTHVMSAPLSLRDPLDFSSFVRFRTIYIPFRPSPLIQKSALVPPGLRKEKSCFLQMAA